MKVARTFAAHKPVVEVVADRMAVAAAEVAHIEDMLALLLQKVVAVPEIHNPGSSWVVAELAGPFQTQEKAPMVGHCSFHPNFRFDSQQSPLHYWCFS